MQPPEILIADTAPHPHPYHPEIPPNSPRQDPRAHTTPKTQGVPGHPEIFACCPLPLPEKQEQPDNMLTVLQAHSHTPCRHCQLHPQTLWHTDSHCTRFLQQLQSSVWSQIIDTLIYTALLSTETHITPSKPEPSTGADTWNTHRCPSAQSNPNSRCPCPTRKAALHPSPVVLPPPLPRGPVTQPMEVGNGLGSHFLSSPSNIPAGTSGLAGSPPFTPGSSLQVWPGSRRPPFHPQG